MEIKTKTIAKTITIIELENDEKNALINLLELFKQKEKRNIMQGYLLPTSVLATKMLDKLTEDE